MSFARLWAGLAVFLLAASCTPAVPDAPPLGLVLDAGGARAADGELRVNFGEPEKDAVEAVTRMLGEYPRRRQRVWLCGITVDWLSGYRMVFVEGAFVGWTAMPGRFDTAGETFPTGDDRRITAGKTCPR